MSQPLAPLAASPETEVPATPSYRVTALDYMPAIAMMALSLAIFIGTAGLKYWDNVTPGARFLPIWLSAAGGLLGILLFISLWRGGDGGVLDLPDRVGLRRAVLALSAMAIFVVAAPVIGMVPVAGIFMLFMLLAVLGQRLVPSLITPAIVVFGLKFIFAYGLSVPLPAPLGF
jgi:putative tricarboxylic transport membrane protein